MSAAAEEQDGSAPETLKSLTLTQDSDASVVLRCPAGAAPPPSPSHARQHGAHVRMRADEEGEPPTKKARASPEGSDASFSLIAMPAAQTRKSFEVTMTTTAPDDTAAQEGVAQIQVLCDDSGAALSPDDKAEVSAVSQAWFTTKEDKDTLANKGHKWKQGMWSKEEVDILMSNIQQYVKGRGIEDPAEIIFEMSKEERKDFYRSVALGLNRPLFAVYRRVLRMYDNRNHVGKYTPGEIEKLKGLRDRHGNDWATIGAALGRSASSVKDRCRLMKDTCNTGKWSEEEERLLAEAVYEMAGVSPGSAVTGGVSWASVANRVATRSEKQCRSKWLNYLNWKHSGGTEWTKDDDLHLTRRILELDVKEENEIKWEDLAGGWSSVRSPQWLRSKWWSIKRQVANHKGIPFPVLLKALHEVMMSSSQSAGGSCSPSSVSSLQIRVGRLEESGGGSAALQIPLQIAHLDSSAAGGEVDTITLNAGALQAFEIIPSFQLQPTSTPGTYLLQTTSSQGLPLSLASNNTVTLTTSSSSASHEHIIFHSLATDSLCASDGVIIQTVASESLIVETEGRRQEERLDTSGLLEHSEKDSEEPTTDGFTDKLTSPAAEVHSGIAAGGAVLIVSPPNVGGTLTDPILENQDGCD
ncbi:cyclin-D-binding Myb-like transcription factor 1 isoform X1 [Phyllopteryx taeniolatus]|uniref:cyclin-D-binding Myb-like transcription factor 1 isoform X1 n=1 Tax=Phyllopteryx taeniolatus TaxID=161469 RepID=UPI002AD2ED80|nr:cyclin-D-binding Myb-like transcription factor 1 isoform X1 [Phyllopteryx taeniolatus]